MPAPSPPLVMCAVLPGQPSAALGAIRASFGTRVDLGHCIYRQDHGEPASSYIVRSAATGSRTIVNYNGLPEMTAAEFTVVADELGSRAGWYHFEVSRRRPVREDASGRGKGNDRCKGRIPDVTLRCIQCVRSRYSDAKISVEVEKPGRKGLDELAAEADVVFYSRSYAIVSRRFRLSDAFPISTFPMPFDKT